ncbi:MAG: CDP-diacylglycerol--glycerol-3-phosphate 3-phosphatidyltransferase [Clostridia bacterium]|nr:CDP-diacylglycerol--glycerol-3-phosphate 3-phosphatidyltransferase [Clostridia bacterium]
MKEKIQKLFSNVWTIPNVLTIIRIILIPVFVVLFFKGEKIAALCVFCAASLTDMLDGYLARKLNQITDFGKLFDPLADKLMVLTAMVCQTFWGPLPLVAVIIVALKELVMVLGGVFMLSKDVVVYSNYFGKAAQVGFIASLILSFFHDRFLKGNVVLWGMTPDIILLWITVALAVVAMGVYAAGAIKTINKKEEKKDEI